MLRAVCSLWRNTIDGAQSFWTMIIDPYCEEYVQLVLANSAAHRSLAVSGKLDAARHLAPALRGAQNYRISDIRFKIGDIAALNRVIGIEWLGVRTVHLSGLRTTFHLRTEVPLHQSFFTAHALTLNCIEIPMSSLIQFRNLRSLELSYELPPIPLKMHMASFLHFLRDQRHLESVKIDVPFDNTSLQPLIPRIRLPTLSTLHLATTTTSAAAFLQSVQLPTLRRLQLNTDEFDHADGPTVALFKEARSLSTMMGFSPSVVRAFSSALFYTHSNVVTVACESLAGYFRLECEAHSLAVAQYLACALRGFGGSLIHTLELDASNNPDPYIQPPPTEPMTYWADVLTRVPDLTDISISNAGYAVENLPMALESLSSAGMTHARVSNLRFTKGEFRTAQCQAWSRYLRMRQSLGDTLSTLTFLSWRFPEEFCLDVFGEVCGCLTSGTAVSEPTYPGNGEGSDTDDSE